MNATERRYLRREIEKEKKRYMEKVMKAGSGNEACSTYIPEEVISLPPMASGVRRPVATNCKCEKFAQKLTDIKGRMQKQINLLQEQLKMTVELLAEQSVLLRDIREKPLYEEPLQLDVASNCEEEILEDDNSITDDNKLTDLPLQMDIPIHCEEIILEHDNNLTDDNKLTDTILQQPLQMEYPSNCEEEILEVDDNIIYDNNIIYTIPQQIELPITCEEEKMENDNNIIYTIPQQIELPITCEEEIMENDNNIIDYDKTIYAVPGRPEKLELPITCEEELMQLNNNITIDNKSTYITIFNNLIRNEGITKNLKYILGDEITNEFNLDGTHGKKRLKHYKKIYLVLLDSIKMTKEVNPGNSPDALLRRAIQMRKKRYFKLQSDERKKLRKRNNIKNV